jgi:hypothetical protein
MSSSIIAAQNQAKARIQETWKAIAENYTTAWMGPIEAVEAVFPHVSSNVIEIRRAISPTLPSIIYQERRSPPEKMSVAVPYAGDDAGYKCRLISTNELAPPETQLLTDFAQALWFLINSGMLPPPQDGKAFEKRLVEWTDKSLIAL